MNPNQNDEVTVQFETDTLNSVSIITAHKLVEIMESDSLESLIHLLLRNLAAETGLIKTSPRIAYPLQARFLPKLSNAYPPDDGQPTAAQLDEIALIVPQDIPLTEIASLIDGRSGTDSGTANEYNLKEMMSTVTEENKHEHIGFGKLVGREKL